MIRNEEEQVQTMPFFCDKNVIVTFCFTLWIPFDSNKLQHFNANFPLIQANVIEQNTIFFHNSRHIFDNNKNKQER